MRIYPKDKHSDPLDSEDKKIDDEYISRKLAIIMVFLLTYGLGVKLLFF